MVSLFPSVSCKTSYGNGIMERVIKFNSLSSMEKLHNLLLKIHKNLKSVMSMRLILRRMSTTLSNHDHYLYPIDSLGRLDRSRHCSLACKLDGSLDLLVSELVCSASLLVSLLVSESVCSAGLLVFEPVCLAGLLVFELVSESVCAASLLVFEPVCLAGLLVFALVSESVCAAGLLVFELVSELVCLAGLFFF